MPCRTLFPVKYWLHSVLLLFLDNTKLTGPDLAAHAFKKKSTDAPGRIRIRLSGRLDTAGAMPAESMNSSSSRQYFPAMWEAFRDQILLSTFQLEALPLDEQHIATRYDHHIFIVIVNVFGRLGRFPTGPEGHLAPSAPSKT